MEISAAVPSRRTFLRTLSFGTACFATPGLFAEELVRTPQQTEGPFHVLGVTPEG